METSVSLPEIEGDQNCNFNEAAAAPAVSLKSSLDGWRRWAQGLLSLLDAGGVLKIQQHQHEPFSGHKQGSWEGALKAPVLPL